MKTLRCAIYTRKSSDEGLEQDFNSLHAQRDACEAYVLSQTGEGWTALKAQYDDGGISGGTMERPGLKALLADISAGRVDIVLVYKLDRLTRSLMDFMKIVEVFDRHQVSFVSVTQSFNTTSSMGRLTLNMLLSFAQFEREVTSERIRDKLAASKKKGLWMGGNLPLGYDADGRTLKINEPEAAQVRHIFERYLELKSVHQLAAELAAEGVVSKQRKAKAGHLIGGGPMRRGALFHLLSNPVYVGKIPHKKVSYAGLHKPIVDPEVFAKAQALLQGNGGSRETSTSSAPTSPLTGRIYDATGARMSPTSSIGSKGVRYRYYVSSSLQLGGKPSPDLARIPAPALEAALRNAMQRLLGIHIPVGDPLRLLRRLDVEGEQVTITFDEEVMLLPGEQRSDGLQRISRGLGVGERAWLDDDQGLKVALPVRMSFRGGRKRSEGKPSALHQSDLTLEACLRRAHQIGRSIGISQVAAALPAATEAVPDTYSRRIVSLSFLAPDVQRIILTGVAPGRLTKQRILENEIPLSWSEQRALFGLPAQ